MEGASCEEVLGTEFLLGEILKRSGGSKAFLRASLVSKFWRATAQIPGVIYGFTSRNRACFLGFVVEHDRGFGMELKLLSLLGTPINDLARTMRARYVPDALYDKYVLGTHGGHVISQIEAPGKQWGKLYMSCMYSKPRAFTSVGCPIPAIPKNPGQYTDNTYGQFAVLPPTGSPGSTFHVFFVKDPSGLVDKHHEGMRFKSGSSVHMHICVFRNGGCIRFVSDPLAPSPLGTFQRSPYCVQAGSVLYMMYLVGFIVCFDVERETFGVVDLPGQMGTTVAGCLQYTVGPHPEGDLAVVHMDNRMLVRWVLIHKGDMADWHQETSIDLVTAFGGMMNIPISTALTVQPSEWHSVQVRSVSPDGQYVLISVGVIHGLFVVDMLENEEKAVPNVGKMARVFPLSENWPPKP